LIVNAERQPYFGRKNLQRAGKPFRQNADNSERPAIDEYWRTERWLILFLPVTIADDCDRRCAARSFLFWQKYSALRGRNAKHGKIVRADNGGEGAPRITLLSDADQREIVGHRVSKHAVLLTDVPISRIGKPAIGFRALFVL